jgi:hypothetical protein
MKANFVYVFDTATGGLQARLGPLENVILHLAVSQDGRYLATTLWGGFGLRVWERTGTDARDWRLVGEDRDYGGASSYGAAFDRNGALYTVANDGKLRRYEPGYRTRPTWVATRGGKEPFSVAVHPSGDRVAVGYEFSKAVEVYGVSPLAIRFSADVVGADMEHLAVAWSTDGERLYGGGKARSGDIRLRVWKNGGRGLAQNIPGPRDTILQVLPCGAGIAFGAGDPAFGLVTPDQKVPLIQEAVQADLRAQRGDNFAAAADGLRVRFGLEEWGKSPVLFDLAAEELKDAASLPNDLQGADISGLPVTDWINNTAPKVGGRPIVLEQYERALALAVAPDKQRFVLSTDWSLRGYDKDGTPLWRKQTPSNAWDVNITGNGKLVVAGYGDGTVRWHRLSDGEELLALFVHAKDRRWVAWTPRGYYAASPGAESLIGWHVNRSWDDAPQFVSVDRFREQFNRPDIVKQVLATLDEGKAVEEANQRANVKPANENVRASIPPFIVIQKPYDNASFRAPEVTLEYHAFSPTGKRITDVDVRINNASLGARAPIPISPNNNDPIRLTLTLPPQDVTITLVAREGTRASQPATVHLRWDGAVPGKTQLPRLRALFIGVNDYTSPNLPKLRFAAKDATDLEKFFASQEGKTYSKVDAKLLPDAKRADVLDGLEWLEKGSEETDVNLLFLAGHGITDEQQQFYYMAADSDPEKARASGVSRNEILQTIRNRKGSMVVMLDACHSGDTAGTTGRQSRVDMNRLVNEFGDKSLGVFLYASALGRQFSYEHADWQNGAFTKALLEGLQGKADREHLGYVETDELALYVRRQVMRMTNNLQEPVRMKPDATPEIRLVVLK